MKKTLSYSVYKKKVNREIKYIPFRFILAMFLAILEILLIIGTVVVLCIYVPYFYVAAYLTQIFCVIDVAASNDNPDYKVPWLLVLFVIPIVGFMCYFLFYSRKLRTKYIKRLNDLKENSYKKDDDAELAKLKESSPIAYSQAMMLSKSADSHVFCDTKVKYYPLGENLFSDLLKDLALAENFIFMEYFIIDEGKLWGEVLEILKNKAESGVEVKLVYDDIGCMTTLSGNYYKKLRKWGIEAVPFSRLKGSADSEFNNRNHRKIVVIDGKVGYTGGVNLADEYANMITRFGHWKDVGVRLQGEAVYELTKLFMIDYGINVKRVGESKNEHFPEIKSVEEGGFIIPFGDGPRPIYDKYVGKTIISSMINTATEYAYIMTPYLIIDNELCECLQNAATRGIDVRIIMPHIPDKKIVFALARYVYPRLLDAGVRIFEYEKGFVHAKNYLVDGRTALVGTMNLDYRSLVHHFENGVWMHDCECIDDIKKDFDQTFNACIEIKRKDIKFGAIKRLFLSALKIFAPMF